MKKIITIVLILILMGGCAKSSVIKYGDSANLDKDKELSDRNRFTYSEINSSTYFFGEAANDEIVEILVPLLPAIQFERLNLYGATFTKGMTVADLEEFLLSYYTKELSDDICETIRISGTYDYSNMEWNTPRFYYEEESDKFFYENNKSNLTVPKASDRYEVVWIKQETDNQMSVRLEKGSYRMILYLSKTDDEGWKLYRLIHDDNFKIIAEVKKVLGIEVKYD